jgi:gamma-glutamylcyclotransferase (GGCT)/AIG2-like uncharacterized protein YtfP
MRFFICGSALRGQPHHANLQGAKFLGPVRTAPRYRLYSVRDEHPGVYAVESEGVSISGELYELTGEQHRRLIAAEPADLYEAAVVLADGSEASAMLYPRALIEERGYTDISRYGGWAQYKAALGQ